MNERYTNYKQHNVMKIYIHNNMIIDEQRD